MHLKIFFLSVGKAYLVAAHIDSFGMDYTTIPTCASKMGSKETLTTGEPLLTNTSWPQRLDSMSSPLKCTACTLNTLQPSKRTQLSQTLISVTCVADIAFPKEGSTATKHNAPATAPPSSFFCSFYLGFKLFYLFVYTLKMLKPIVNFNRRRPTSNTTTQPTKQIPPQHMTRAKRMEYSEETFGSLVDRCVAILLHQVHVMRTKH